MFFVHRILAVATATALSGVSMFAQNVISAKSGLVHYIEGEVSVDGKSVSDKPGVFTDVKKGGELATAAGRAEMLLTPGVFLRVGEQSHVVMRDASLADTQVELISGNAMLESDTPMKDNKVTVIYKDYAVSFKKYGLYGFQTEPAQIKVFKGEAEVVAGGQTVMVHEGHLLAFTAALAQQKFDVRDGDSLYRWSKLRSEYISVANVSAAKSAGNFGSSYRGTGFGNWYYNSFYGMYTYLPYAGTSYSPFGYGYYSPGSVGQFYNNYYYANSGGSGGNSGNMTSSRSGTNSTVLSSNTPSVGTTRGGSGGGLVGGGSGHAGGGSGGSVKH